MRRARCGSAEIPVSAKGAIGGGGFAQRTFPNLVVIEPQLYLLFVSHAFTPPYVES